ncbi:MAG: hypothetical protein KDH92_03625 [Chloroflexi bacterium]|nr:hypothetical protein [Chloroflexota bacterium]
MLSVSPNPLILDGGGTQVLGIQIDDAPAFEGFTLELGYDAERLAVTALEAGALIAAPGASLTLESGSEPGLLRIGYARSEAPDGAPGSESDGERAGWPQDGGPLVMITLAPLAVSEGPIAITIGPSELRLTDGTTVELPASRAEVLVQSAPDPESLAAFEAQAEGLIASAQSGGPGLGRTLRAAFSDLGHRLGILEPGPRVVWLGLLGLALIVVALGWSYGRRPLASDAASARADDRA